MVSWGDNLLPAHRRVIESTFGCKVFDSYGCAEGFQVAAQCGHGSGYHLHDFDVVVEYVGDDGAPVGRGETGAVVVTRLEAGPMPLIRYRPGDAAIGGSQEICSCGRTLGRLAAVRGRESDVIVTPGGNRLIVHFFTGILEHFREIESFQVVQQEQDEMTVNVVPTQPGWQASVGDRIRQSLLSKGANGMRITVQPVAAIPLTNAGKRRFVVAYRSSTQNSGANNA
jgi:phenylacetate-CoA ligase